MKKLMLLMTLLAVALVAAAPAALTQDNPQVVADATTKTATAGGPAGANAEADCKDGVIESKAGGVVARALCTPPPPPPPPPAPAPVPAPKAQAPAPAPPAAPQPEAPPAPAPAPAPKAELPQSGGADMASLFALGSGVLLVAGGLFARGIIK